MYKSISTLKGNYKYKYIPIFEGFKVIDKQIANENLQLLKEICDRNHLQFILMFGTLLGAVREHDFIDHDEDIDLVMDFSDLSGFLGILFELRENGFEMARFERRGFLSIIRKGEYIDIYFFQPYPNDTELRYCCQDICEKKYVEELAPLEFLGNTYMAPKDYEGYLEHQYGKNWRTPVKFFTYKKPGLGRYKQIAVQYIKLMLPAAVTEWIQQKKEQPPKLYDLTTLQREANRIFGYTAKQTLDYAQTLYEKKLLTYPRTDSRYLTSDMAETASCVIHLAAKVPPFDKCSSFYPLVELMVSYKDVTDHHAIIPTMETGKADISALPVGERNLFLLVCCRLLCAAANPYEYETVTASFECGGHTFTAKGKHILSEGWLEIERIFRSSLKEKPKDEDGGADLPELMEGETYNNVTVDITEHYTQPPKPFTEDTLLSAMENAGKADMPDEAERKGLGTPATRAAIIEKLVTAGFVERKGKNLIPTKAGMNLVTVLPEPLTSPMLTQNGSRN